VRRVAGSLAAVVAMTSLAHAVPPCVRDVAIPLEVPPPADAWASSPRRAASLCEDAGAALAADDAADALRLVERAMALDSETNPAMRDYYTLRAACMTKLGDTGAAAAVSHYNDASRSSEGGDYAAARRLYDRALSEDPLMLWAANNRAWLAATHPDPDARRDPDAKAYALYACVNSDWHNWSFIDTLGAVYAESGDFAAAIRCAERALVLAPAESREEVRDSLATYRSGQPRRDPVAAPKIQRGDRVNGPFAEAAEPGGELGLVEHLAVQDLANLMKREGWAATIREGRFIEWKIDGYKSQLFLGDDGRSLQFHAAFTDGQVTLAAVNEWNRTKRYSKSYLDDDGDPHLELDLDCSGGISEDRILDFFHTCRRSFGRWTEDVVK
jgi:tetratricopeptide (TPR) repeat protein